MIPAAELRAGMAVRFDGAVYRVLSAEAHQGGGKMGGATPAHAHLPVPRRIPVPALLLGPLTVFLKEDMALPVEFFEERPVRIVLPGFADLKVTTTAAPMKGGEQSTWKPATLENGLQVQVPLFVASGDTIRIEVANRRYTERLRETGRR